MNQPATATNRARGAAANPEETKALLLDAAIRTLSDHGYAGTTARAVAAEAGVNPALISYHFGGMRPLLLAAMARSNEQRLERYEVETAPVRSVAELIAAWRRLHDEDVEVGHIGALVAMLGATSSDPEIRTDMADLFQPWLTFTADRVVDAVKGSPLEHILPTDQAAFVILSLFVGMELLTNLDGYDERADELFTTGEALARFLPPGLLGKGMGR